MTDDYWRTAVLRRLDALEQDIKDLDTRLRVTEESNQINQTHAKEFIRRLDGIENTLRYAVRLLIGSFLTLVTSLILNFYLT